MINPRVVNGTEIAVATSSEFGASAMTRIKQSGLLGSRLQGSNDSKEGDFGLTIIVGNCCSTVSTASSVADA